MAYAKPLVALVRRDQETFQGSPERRFLDLVAILSCLVIGLLMFRVIDDAGRLPTFELIALNAGAVIGLTMLGIFIVRSGNLGKFKLRRLRADTNCHLLIARTCHWDRY